MEPKSPFNRPEGDALKKGLAKPGGETAPKSKGEPVSRPEPMTMGKSAKEMVESILIAFVLAFVFRAFVVEAFVIPTGSMATTLLGAHMRFTCKECGYRFTAGYQSPNASSTSDDIDIPAKAGPVSETYVDSQNRQRMHWVDRVYGVYCPNCKYRVPKDETTNPPISYGDRILVLKYLYIPWISMPNRWDVVVFKNPTDRKYAQNYIKRLIGLPGEEIRIIDGDVYANKAPADGSIAGQEKWEVQTKPRHAQDAQWRIVYDNDYRPLEFDRGDRWQFPWVQTDGGGWNTGANDPRFKNAPKPREFEFKNLAGRGALEFNFAADRRFSADWLAYNASSLGDDGRNVVEQYWNKVPHFTAGDLKLTFFMQRKSGDGVLRAKMSKYDHEFIAELAPDQARLLHRLPDGRILEVGKPFALKPGTGLVRVDLINADYRVQLRINDQVVIETDRQQYAPDIERLLEYQRRDIRGKTPTVAIVAERQETVLSHISLWRDVYYTSIEVRNGWQLSHGRPDKPAVLGADEFFVMGDNSQQSYDARFWGNRIELPDEDLHVEAGRVPGRFMLGKAFFVYWPAGFRPLNGTPSIVPNFGEMRVIH